MRRLSAILGAAFVLSCGTADIKPTISGGNSGGDDGKPEPDKYLYVNLKQGSQGDGSQKKPYQSIQEAIEAAAPNTEVRIAAGQYNQSVELKAGVSLKGGYSTSSWKTHDPAKHPTVILDTSFAGGNSADEPTATILIKDSSTPLEISHITIVGASVDKDASNRSEYNESAGAIHIENSSGVYIRNARIFGGETGQFTFAVSAHNSNVNFADSEFSGGKGNTSYGIYLTGSTNGTVARNTIKSAATDLSVGFYSAATQPIQLFKNKFSGSTGAKSCYGVLTYATIDGVLKVSNNVIYDANCSTQNIGLEVRGETVRKGQVHLRNNTIAGGTNSSTALSAPISLKAIDNSPVEITNNMLLDFSSYLDGGCIYEQENDSIPHMVRHNNFHGCNHIYRKMRGGSVSYHNIISHIENDLELNATNNVATDPQLDDEFKYVGNPKTSLTYGGIDGSQEEWIFLDDHEGSQRTSDDKGTGWSIGAFEFD